MSFGFFFFLNYCLLEGKWQEYKSFPDIGIMKYKNEKQKQK